MAVFDKKPQLFRVVILFLGLVFLALSVNNFIRTTSKKVGGIFFENLPSNLYVVKPFSVYPESMPNNGNDLEKSATIPPGDFIVLKDKIEAASINEFYETINKKSNTEPINFLVFDINSYNVRQYYTFKENIPPEFVKWLDYGELIEHVVEGSGADRAGLHVGDVLTGIGDVKVSPDYNATLRFLSHQKPGAIIPYYVTRGDQELKFDVQLAYFGVQLSYLGAFLSGLLLMGAAMFFGMKRPGLPASRLVSLALLLLGMAAALSASLEPIDLDWFTVLRNDLSQTGICLGIPILFHSMMYFPSERTSMLRHRWIIVYPYLIGIILLGAYVISYATSTWNDIALYFQILGYGLIVSRIVIKLVYRKQSTKEQRRITRLINGVLLFNLAIWFGSYILEFMSIKPSLLMYLSNYTVFPLMAIPAAYIYTVGRWRLLGFEWHVRRNRQYTLLSTFWMVLLIGIFILTIGLLSGIHIQFPALFITESSIEISAVPMDSELGEVYEKITLVISSFLLGYLFWKISVAGRKFLDNKYFRIKFDYRRAADELRQAMNKSLASSLLTRIIAEKLSALLMLKNAGVIFFKNESNVCCQDFSGHESNELMAFTTDEVPNIANAVKQYTSSFRVDYMPDPSKTMFKNSKFQYIVPIISKNKLVGALFIGEKLSEAPFNLNDLDFLTSIAGYAAISIENAFLYEDLAEQDRIKHELELARHIQVASLPQTEPKVEGLDISGISVPAFEVGGDFYDFLDGQNNELTVIIGDVSGKGTSAALYMSRVQGILRTLYEFDLDPKELFTRTNNHLYKYLDRGSFITSLGMKIFPDEKKIKMVRAGHLPAYHFVSGSKSVSKLVPAGIGLGLTERRKFVDSTEEIEMNYSAGDIFLLVSDGVTESRNSQMKEYGEERLIECLVAGQNANALAIRDGILRSVREFSNGSEQWDDITIVVIKAG